LGYRGPLDRRRLRQEEDIIENLAGHALFTRSHHHNSLSDQKKALHRITDERLCSTKASLLSLLEISNRYASINCIKIAVICSLSVKPAARLLRGESGCA
jgi:hypothetical protein